MAKFSLNLGWVRERLLFPNLEMTAIQGRFLVQSGGNTRKSAAQLNFLHFKALPMKMICINRENRGMLR